VVYRWPYDYSNPNYEEDFVQNVPMKEGEEVLSLNNKKAFTL
jgi:cytochrome c oxidase subunit 1